MTTHAVTARLSHFGADPLRSQRALSVTGLARRQSRDAPLLLELLQLHALSDGQILDCTFGRGAIWGRLALRHRLIKSDVNAELPGLDLACDWLELPFHFGRASIDVLVWDPIHVPDVGHTSARYARYVSSARPVNGPSVTPLFAGFLDVAEWLVKPITGVCLVKLKDIVHGGRFRRQVAELEELAIGRGWTVCDRQPIVTPSAAAPDPKHLRQLHAHSDVTYWIVLRNGPACQGPGRLLVHQVRCRGCGDVFLASRRDAKTCSSRCRQRARRAHLGLQVIGAGARSA